MAALLAPGNLDAWLSPRPPGTPAGRRHGGHRRPYAGAPAPEPRATARGGCYATRHVPATPAGRAGVGRDRAFGRAAVTAPEAGTREAGRATGHRHPAHGSGRGAWSFAGCLDNARVGRYPIKEADRGRACSKISGCFRHPPASARITPLQREPLPKTSPDARTDRFDGLQHHAPDRLRRHSASRPLPDRGAGAPGARSRPGRAAPKLVLGPHRPRRGLRPGSPLERCAGRELPSFRGAALRGDARVPRQGARGRDP